MNDSQSKKFVLRFNGVSSANANQLAEKLYDKLRKEAGETVQVSRQKDDPDTLDSGGILIVIITTTVVGIQSPHTMAEALLAALLVEFVLEKGVEVQVENEIGDFFKVIKDFQRATIDTVKNGLQSFFKKDKQD